MDNKHYMARMVSLWFLVLLVVMLGIILLIAEKTVAGLSFIVTGIIIVLPLKFVYKKHKSLKWLQIIAILILCFVAVISIAGTDIPPDTQTVGFKFADQIIMIFQNFLNKIVPK